MQMKIKALFYGNQILLFRMFYLKLILKRQADLDNTQDALAGSDNMFM